ncbi:pleckstrin homology domain-containing family J member 1-like [Agrilus planipennis]|uniref:Pleckstrin homology domain-containing family J member 1 n=1 Tax=Agrilus planipennis TaxID=224129 RepID=A0A1W4WRK0_AGRPL|nr:pleckstrin homology domain-containing family J member 1-like [Agrilus planipennis]
MRFNDKELAKLSESKGEMEGVLHHLKPSENEWSDWYQQPYFKERFFKLVSNLLFYFRVNEQEPIGILVLENVQVAYERPHKGISFAFSLTFKTGDKSKIIDQKHIFSCRCDEDVNKWVCALKVASYEHWRSQLIILKTKIHMRTGQDPILDYLKQETKNSSKNHFKTVCAKSSFQSHIETKLFTDANGEIETVTTTQKISKNCISNKSVLVGKLVDI